MKPIRHVIAAATLLVLGTVGARAEVVTEATLGSGYQGNIFSDSSMTGDVRATAGMALKYYPVASVELAGGIEYSGFESYRDLSSLAGELTATIIPFSETSRVIPALNAGLTTRRFGTTYELYDQSGASIGIGLVYHLAPWMQTSSQVSYTITEYYNSSVGSNQGYSVRSDLHITVAGSNALSLGLDYSRRAYDQPFISSGADSYSLDADQVRSEIFAVSGLQLRFSRPLGMRTGLSLSAGRRFMHLNQDQIVPGYTVDFLSPWADLWNGNSLSGSIKHFFPRQLTVDVSVAYLDKNFTDALELSIIEGDVYEQYSRDDQMLTTSFTLAKAISLNGGTLVTPTLGAGYRNNRSSMDLFSYDDFWASFSMTLSL